MEDNYNGYGFCPKCGAVMRDGVCTSCGFRNWGSENQQDAGQHDGGYQGGGYQDTGYRGGYDQYGGYGDARPPKKRRKGLIIGIVIAVVLIVIVVIAVAAWNMFFRFRGGMSEEYYGYDDPEGGFDDGFGDDWDYYGDSYDSSYVPSEDDSYYEEIVDCTRTDLEYAIVWSTLTLYPDDQEESSYFYANYPLISSDDGGYEELNELISEEALKYKDEYTDYDGGCTVLGYVTYMAEDMLSVVFQFTVYDNDEELYIPTISALNFNMETGEAIENDEMAEVDDELVMRFRAQDSVQNGGVDFVQDATDDELYEMLTDPDTAVFFYSPVGLEAGINYDGGWVTVTLKDQSL